jgi:hypothetical protein
MEIRHGVTYIDNLMTAGFSIIKLTFSAWVMAQARNLTK